MDAQRVFARFAHKKDHVGPTVMVVSGTLNGIGTG